MSHRKVALALVDISGYTRFIRMKRVSALHAEEVIFELLGEVVRNVTYPLQVNKLEGDAVFLFAEMTAGHEVAVARDVFRQAQAIFPLFYARARALSEERSGCDCGACRHIGDLRLKVVLHSGEAVFRRILHFEELAGEDVILIHRLLKNSLAAKEYILMTDAFYRRLLWSSLSTHPHREEYEGFGTVLTHVLYLQDAFVPHLSGHGPQVKDEA